MLGEGWFEVGCLRRVGLGLAKAGLGLELVYNGFMIGLGLV